MLFGLLFLISGFTTHIAVQDGVDLILKWTNITSGNRHEEIS
jgi:hypothetical protein